MDLSSLLQAALAKVYGKDATLGGVFANTLAPAPATQAFLSGQIGPLKPIKEGLSSALDIAGGNVPMPVQGVPQSYDPYLSAASGLTALGAGTGVPRAGLGELGVFGGKIPGVRMGADVPASAGVDAANMNRPTLPMPDLTTREGRQVLQKQLAEGIAEYMRTAPQSNVSVPAQFIENMIAREPTVSPANMSPERIIGATYTVGNKVYDAPNHVMAMDKAVKDLGLTGTDELIDHVGWDNRRAADGFRTSTGRVVDRQEAARIAQEAEQGAPTRPGSLKAEDILRKYGLVGLTAGGLGGALAGGQDAGQ